MKKSLFEQIGGKYIRQGDYLLPNLTLSEEDRPIGIWGRRHARHLKQHHKIIYMNLLTSGKLNAYLADIDNKAENQMKWGAQVNNIGNRAIEIVNNEMIYI